MHSTSEGTSAGKAPSMEAEDSAAPLLLSLSDDVLLLIVSEVEVRGKNGFRSTCRRLRLAVNACTSALTWAVPSSTSAGGTLQMHLPAALAAACPALRLLDCNQGPPDCNGPRQAQPGSPDVSQLYCPPVIRKLLCTCCNVQHLDLLAMPEKMLQTLDCSHTRVIDLAPLAACARLQTLNCSHTRVVELGPLVACTRMQTLDCNHIRITGLGPLAACTLLQTLDCSHTIVAQLGPPAACSRLQTLDCSHTRVAELGPLAACTDLRTLDCSHTRVAHLGPLAACTGLQTLDCSRNSVAELGPLAACSLLLDLDCHSTSVADLGPLAMCTRLQALDCCFTWVTSVSPLAACTALRALFYVRSSVPRSEFKLLQAARGDQLSVLVARDGDESDSEEDEWTTDDPGRK